MRPEFQQRVRFYSEDEQMEHNRELGSGYTPRSKGDADSDSDSDSDDLLVPRTEKRIRHCKKPAVTFCKIVANTRIIMPGARSKKSGGCTGKKKGYNEGSLQHVLVGLRSPEEKFHHSSQKYPRTSKYLSHLIKSSYLRPSREL